MAVGMGPFDHGVVRLTFDLGPHQLAIGLQNMGNYDPLTGDRVSVYHAVDVDNIIIIGMCHGAHIFILPLQGRFVGIDLRSIEYIFFEYPIVVCKVA